MKKFLTILLIALMAGAMVFAVPTFTGNASIKLDYNTVRNQHTWDAYMDGDGISLGFTDDLWSVSVNTGSMDINSNGGITAKLKLADIIAKSIGYQTKTTIDLDFGWGDQKASMYYTGHSADSSIYGDTNKLSAVSYASNLMKFKKLTLAFAIDDNDTSGNNYWSTGFTGKATVGYAGLKIIGAVAVNERSGSTGTVITADNRQSFGFAIEGANLAEFINFSAGLSITKGMNAMSIDFGNVYTWKVNANFDLAKVFGWGIGLKLDGFGQFIGADNYTELSQMNLYAGQVTGTFGAFSAYVEYTNEADYMNLSTSRLNNVNVGGAWAFNDIFSLSANLCIPAVGANWSTTGVELGFDAGVTAAYGSFTAYAGATKGVWKDWNNEVGFKSSFKFVF